LFLLAEGIQIRPALGDFPLQLLFCNVVVVVAVVIGFIADVPDPGVMDRPPRTPGSRIATGAQTVRWVVSGFLIAGPALGVLAWGPGEPSTTDPSTSMTMAFAVVAFSAVNMGLVMRRERQAPWASPVFPFLGWIFLGWALTLAAVVHALQYLAARMQKGDKPDAALLGELQLGTPQEAAHGKVGVPPEPHRQLGQLLARPSRAHGHRAWLRQGLEHDRLATRLGDRRRAGARRRSSLASAPAA